MPAAPLIWHQGWDLKIVKADGGPSVKRSWRLASLATAILLLWGCGNARLFRIVQSQTLGPDWIDPSQCPLNDGRCKDCSAEKLSRYRALVKSLRARGTPVLRSQRNLFPYDSHCSGNIYDDLRVCIPSPKLSIVDCVDAGASPPVITQGIGSDNEDNLPAFGHDAIIRRHAVMFAFRAKFRDCDDQEKITETLIQEDKAALQAGADSRSRRTDAWKRDVDEGGDWTWWPVEFVSWSLGLLDKAQINTTDLVATISESEFDRYLEQYTNALQSYNCRQIRERVLSADWP